MTPPVTSRFHGIYPSTLCPFREDYTIDAQALEAHVGGLATISGIAGILCNGHAGENFLLSREEKARVVRISRQAMGTRGLLVAGVVNEDSLAAAEEARDAIAAGADAVMIFAPFSWVLSQDEGMALRHHSIICAAVERPVMLFQGSVRAGRMAYPPAVLSKLLSLPNLVAIKEGSWETAAYEATRRQVRAEAPHVAVMASGDEHLLACYVLGSEGSLVSLAVLIPEVIVALDATVRRGDMPAARAAHDVVYPLARAIYGAPVGGATMRLKACLHLLGRLPNALARPPSGPLDREEMLTLSRLLTQVGLR